MAPPGTAQRNGLKTEERERKRSSRRGQEQTRVRGGLPANLAGRGSRTQGRPGGRTGPAFPVSAADGWVGAPRPPRRGSPEQQHLGSAPGRSASELPNPEGQDGLSRPPPPASLPADGRAPRSVQARAAALPTPAEAATPAAPPGPRKRFTCAAGGGPDTTRMRRGKRGLPGGFWDLWKTCSALGDSCSLRTRTGRRRGIPPPLPLPPRLAGRRRAG